MDFEAPAVFAAPFPSDHRRRPDGRVDLAGFPGRQRTAYVRALFDRAGEVPGFSPLGAVFFAATGPLATDGFPTPAATVFAGLSSGPTVFAYRVDGDAGIRRVPLQIRFQLEGGPYGAPFLLAAVPVQGVGFAPGPWAVVVTTGLRDAAGRALEPWPAAGALATGAPVAGLGDAAANYRAAAARWAALGLAPAQVAGMAVFTVVDAAASMPEARRWDATQGARMTVPLTLRESFPGYCVFAGEASVPVYQEGEPPFAAEGGRWAATPTPDTMARREQSRVVVTLPRSPMPEGGYPTVLFIRTGGGGDRPLVDRGVRGPAGSPDPAAGTGLAADFAAEGFAAITWDGPHGGPRNVRQGDEQFLMFNVGNLGALRDNVRQSALEAALLAELLPTLRVEASSCAVGTASLPNAVRFDAARLGLFGHSMGASIAPLAAAASGRFGAVLLSGGGGSFIANVLYKQRPIPVRAAAEALLGYPGTGRSLRDDDPALTVLQWALDLADVAPYAEALAARPGGPHVFMQQGIVDRYILPPIANTLSLSWSLDLTGPSLDAPDARLSAFDPFERLAPFVGAARVDGALGGNRAQGMQTRALRQYPEDGIEDGHEVAFQRADARRDLRCFLRSWLRTGVPRVPAPGMGCD